MRVRITSSTLKIQLIISLMIFLCGVTLFAWIIIQHQIRAMKYDFIKKSQILAAMVDPDQLLRLTVSDADLKSSDYLKIKEQLALAIQSIPNGRFLYLTGKNPDGKIFFYADNEIPGAKDESPPGQVYQEASENFHNVFLKGVSICEGPFTDRWGTWITALSPILDPKTGQTAAVLGMDIAVSDWYWNVATRSAIPIMLFSILLIISFSLFFYKQPVDVMPKPVLKRLLWPLLIIIGIIMVSFTILLWWQQNSLIQKNIKHTLEAVPHKFQAILKGEADAISKTFNVLANDRAFQQNLITREKSQLFETYQTVFHNFVKDYTIAEISFLTPEGGCLLGLRNAHGEIHQNSYCDAADIDVASAVTHYSLALSPSELLSLMVIQPVMSNSTIIGYIVLWKGIENVLENILEPELDLAILLHKDRVNQTSWEKHMRSQGLDPDWNRFSNHVLTYSSVPIFDTIEHVLNEHPHYWEQRNVISQNQIWRTSLIPLYDIVQNILGDLLVLYDISSEKMNFKRLILIFGSGLAIVLTALFVLIFIILHWADQGIIKGEKQLRENELFLNSLLESIPIPVFVKELDGTYKGFNRAFELFFGKTREQLIGRTAFDITHGSLAEFSSEKDAILFKSPTTQTYESQLKTATGETKNIILKKASLIDQNGHVTGLVGAIFDITDRKNAEDALRESEKRFQSVVSNVPGVIFRCANDADWTMEFISQRIVDIAGYPAHEFVHNAVRSYRSIIHPDDAVTVSQVIYDALAEKKAYSIEYRILSEDGSVKWIKENGRGLSNDEGLNVYIDGVIIDITQQKIIEHEMIKMSDQLLQSKKMAAIGKLSAGVAHEIKNPLAIILLSIDAFSQAIELNDNNRTLLETMRKSAERADKIVTDLLNFSHQLKIRMQAIQPKIVIGAAIAAIRQDAAFPANIDVANTQNVPDNIFIDADPVLMEHVLLNILRNAVDALSSRGGHIRISTEFGNSSITRSDQITIKISDDGPGIPSEIMDRIFEPFVTTKEIGKGTGLGLSLAYAIVERHNGTMTVESTPGAGSIFTIFLPCRRQEAT